MCTCHNIFSYAIQIHDHLLIGLTLQKLMLLGFVICQCSNNAWKCEQWFMKDLVQKFKILSRLFNYFLACVHDAIIILLLIIVIYKIS